MKFSAKSKYGLRAMVCLARVFDKKEPYSLKKISQKEKISFDYLEKIISDLKKQGLVKAKKGLTGGYFLSKPPSKIKVGEIIKVLEGEMTLVKCMDKKKTCPKEKRCLTKDFWREIKKSLDSALNSMTLEDLIKTKK